MRIGTSLILSLLFAASFFSCNRNANTTGEKRTSGDRVWGGIPHMAVSVWGYDFDAPVAVRFMRGDQKLERDADGLIYALPNGGRINSNSVILK